MNVWGVLSRKNRCVISTAKRGFRSRALATETVSCTSLPEDSVHPGSSAACFSEPPSGQHPRSTQLSDKPNISGASLASPGSVAVPTVPSRGSPASTSGWSDQAAATPSSGQLRNSRPRKRVLAASRRPAPPIKQVTTSRKAAEQAEVRKPRAAAELQEVYRDKENSSPIPVQDGRQQQFSASPTAVTDLAEFLSVFDQLPSCDTEEHEDAAYFDWSGRTDYTSTCKQADLPYWGMNKMNDQMRPVAVQRKGQDLEVLPLWISVCQREDGGPARLYRSTIPLSDAIVKQLTQPLDQLLLCAVEDMDFDKPDVANGAWRNYCTGIIGSVAHKEEDVLWPNQVLHGNRAVYNLRNGFDLATFLAAPKQQNLEQHQQFLRRMQEDRQYKPGWIWHVMKDRWGGAALRLSKLDFSH